MKSKHIYKSIACGVLLAPLEKEVEIISFLFCYIEFVVCRL